MNCLFLTVAVSTALISPFAIAKDVTVAKTGGDFQSVQAAVDAAPDNGEEAYRILIQPGTYEQKLTIPKNKSHVQFIGKGTKPEETVLTYHLKASDPKPDGTGNVGTSGSTSTLINGNDFLAENVTFANSAGDNVGQAVALKTQGDRLIFRNCRFLGFQDTLYPAGNGRCYFKDCYITGDTDFIFGSATAVFDHCTINSTDFGFDTAANTPANRKYGYVLLDCTLTASANVKPGSVFLGRPWQWDKTKPAVAYVRTKMGPHISPKGWHPWDAKANVHPEETTRYSEFGSTDLDGKPIDLSQRVKWAHQMTEAEAAELTIANVLGGEDHWDPTAVDAKN